jgi:uncharacterized protein YjbJ (UPF0337 family)
MDKDRIAGAANAIKGSVKETIGKATGDTKLEADGKADKGPTSARSSRLGYR